MVVSGWMGEFKGYHSASWAMEGHNVFTKETKERNMYLISLKKLKDKITSAK